MFWIELVNPFGLCFSSSRCQLGESVDDTMWDSSETGARVRATFVEVLQLLLVVTLVESFRIILISRVILISSQLSGIKSQTE